jgi:plasmid stabilization system protein ParE
LLRRYPFSVVYRVESARILIVAVAHGRRRPGHWKSRL